MSDSTSRRRRPRRLLGPVAAVVLVTAGAVSVVAGVGVTTASAAATTSTASDTVTVEAFRETVKPWDSITIPSLSCPDGSWLTDEDVSPGRGVPRGVEVTGDSGWIETTISAVDHST